MPVTPANSEVLRFDRLYIGGEWVLPEEGGLIESIDPSTGAVWALVARPGHGDVDRAVAAARAAPEGPWGTMPGHERAALMRRFSDLYQARADIGGHHNGCTGGPRWPTRPPGGRSPFDNTVHAFTSRVPVGVVAPITPWNVPLMAAAWKPGPALAAGCTVVLKPTEQTPVGTLEPGRLFEAAGFPPGVGNIVPGYGGGDVGERSVAHPGVDKVAFTGEDGTTRAIVNVGSQTMKRFTFAPGGKSPHIIFDDAVIEKARKATTNSAWTLCGQSCALGSRVQVQRPVYDRGIEGFRERAARVRVGPALDAGARGHHAIGQSSGLCRGLLLRCAPHPEGRSQELKQMLFRALDHVLSDLGSTDNGSAETPFERFKFLIGASRGRAGLSLVEVAAAMELSPRQLQRFFAKPWDQFPRPSSAAAPASCT